MSKCVVLSKQIQDGIREIANERACIEDDSVVYEWLYSHYFEGMPYGVAKAREGDPSEWLTERVYLDFGHLMEEEEGLS